MQIFLSYNWNDEKIADEVDNTFRYIGVELTRDKRDIKYKDSFKEFMKKVRKSDYVIMIISDDYLKSVNCMFEVLEFIKDEDHKARILPIVLENKVNIFKPQGALHYIEYWENEYKILEESMKKVDISNLNTLTLELRKIKEITSSISEFTSNLADMNCSNIERLRMTSFKDILQIINHLDQYPVTTQYFLKDLKRATYFEISHRPDIPDKETKYELIDFKLIDAMHGQTLILEMKEKSEGTPTTMVIPDIEFIEYNTLSGEYHSKYYFQCMVRPIHYEYEKGKEMEKYGYANDKAHLATETFMTYRIILFY
ncbi:toll/interleukin-1 receptor domain-containing protein [Paenibacillus paridis]|uniref:toll/interleukin-1 receptor domain-containing protein n=1 Tax=Paenibacillus paridis TaxID=2583376 RepID=UPI001EE3E145|nr:toll/interleukin-1 receptor domain-containing protein [Paenibacillus paridis]